MTDVIRRPKHYRYHPSGLECIDVTRSMDYLTGCSVKYLWRAGQKGDRLEDLGKAAQYLDWAIKDDVHVPIDWGPFLTWYGDADDSEVRDEDSIIHWILRDELDEARICLTELIETLTGQGEN